MLSVVQVAVTGSSGFVGSHLALGLAQNGFEVTAISGKNPCPPEIRSASKQVFNVDLASEMGAREVLVAAQPDIIVHAAALAQAPICENNPELAKASNILSTRNIVKIAQQYFPDKPPIIVFISSDLVFDGGEAPAGGFSEEDPPCPHSVYGHTKVAAERIILDEAANSFVLRLSIVYGRRIGTHEGFMGWLRGGLEAGEDVRVFLDEFRTPIYSGDLIKGLLQVLQLGVAARASGEKNRSELLHLAGPERISRYDLGLKVAEKFGYRKDLLVPVEQAAADNRLGPRPRDASLSVRKAAEKFGVEFHGIDSGLSALLAETRS